MIHLDANQGDACVIITPNGQVAMVDEGTNFTAGSSPPSCAKVLSQLQSLGISHIDLHFASHYHADHIGCITSLTGVTIDQGWDRASSYSSSAYTSYVSYLGAKRHTLTKGRTFTLDSLSAHPVTIKCVALGGDGVSGGSSDENGSSLSLKVSYGEFDEEIGGDLTGSSPDVESVVGPQVGHVEVYKAHHHGSATSNNANWMTATTPKICVISCGNGNSYGHPTTAALDRMHARNVRTYWTQQGAVHPGYPNPTWDKIANSMIRIECTWEPGGVDSIYATGIADTFTNSGTALDHISPNVTVLAPNGGETVAAGGSTNINWSASDNVGVTSVDVDYSLDDGGNWSPLVAGGANSGTYAWSVPDSPSALAKVRIAAHDASGNTGAAISASDFTVADQTAPSVTLGSPDGGESWPAGSSQNVAWTAGDNVGVDSVNLDFSVHGADGPWDAVQHGLANSGAYNWTIPAVSTDSALLRVTAFDHALNTSADASNGLFQLTQVAAVNPGGPLKFALAHPRPNPSRGNVTLTYSLRTAAETRVDVLDVNGRRVWGTRSASVGAGSHTVAWDGRDERGNAAGSGLYFVRLTSGADQATSRFVLLR